GPRIIDMDILLYGSAEVHEAQLGIPHPRMQERRFVLVPFAEIAPDVVHPVLHKSIRELRDALSATAENAVEVSAPQTVPANRELTGLRALITGSTSGIGKAI